MKIYDFTKTGWESGFEYAYSPVARSFNSFSQNDGCISNSYNEDIGAYDYVSIAETDTYCGSAEVLTECSFDSFGAPLITVANSVFADSDGRLHYGDHYEVVAYENGCNVWLITLEPEGAEKPYKVEKCAFAEFPIEAGSRISISVKIRECIMEIDVNGIGLEVAVPQLAERFRIGLTACEGINRFYSARFEK